MLAFENQAKNLLLVDLQVIAAEGEQKASRALKEASDIISESPAALQLRFAHNIIQKYSYIWVEVSEDLSFLFLDCDCAIIIYFALARYLQTLATISSEKNSTIVFPIPIEMFSKFIKND